jgi:N-acetylneuraminic acid mutarotase
VAALLVIAALAATIASVGSNLQRNQNDLIVEPTSSVAPHLSLPPTLSPSGAPAVASWSATGSLITARSQTNLILLGDGRVLAVGGCSDLVCHALASAEIYDPATRSWSATASMTQARSGNSATLLQNGKVLVAGGSAFGQIGDASAALFDPASGSWSATGNMLEPRSGHSATLLPNGQVLVAGGTTDRPCAAGVPGHCFDELSSAELYDPRTGMWSATGSMTVGRVGHPAILLGDGNVLVVGGAYFPRDSADVYDATTGTWRATGRMTAKREFQTATLLPDGKVLVAGGRDASHSPVKRLASAEQYDPTTSRWSATGSMAIGLIGHTATLLADGKVLVLGDRGGGTSGSDAELYDPATGLWGATPTWISSLGPCAGIRLADGRVLIVGGVSNGHVLESSEIYDPGDLR